VLVSLKILSNFVLGLWRWSGKHPEKKRRHTEIPRLTASASTKKEEAGMALSR
jgi:hypothetical protein